MRLVITGASGYVASQIIPHLEKEAELVLVGRDQTALENRFPGHITCTYDSMWTHVKKGDALLHLTVINNNQKATLEEARAINVTLLKEIVKKARKAGVAKFLFTSTTHALASSSKTAYARTKREAEDWLWENSKLPMVILSLPAVHGSQYSGRLAVLNFMPEVLRPPMLKLLSTLLPTASAKTIVAAIQGAVNKKGKQRLVVSDRQTENYAFRVVKRAIDLVFALVVLGLFWWLLLAIWLAVKATSKGPGLFAQIRIGRDQRQFVCLKFRTMYEGTSEVGTHDIDSAAITPIGRFLRRTKLDELPQVWNILRNDLSLVGPRPCMPIQLDLIDERAKAQIFSIKPGITGLAQIRGVDMRDPQEITKWDQRYLELQSLLMDLKIIFRTAID